MQALGVVDVCDEVIDAGACVFDCGEAAGVDFFVLEGFHEAFGLGVVEGIAKQSADQGS